MDALEALHNRSSVPKLGDPEPSNIELQNIYKAAMRAADHAVLRPWRFLTIRGKARQHLGELFVNATLARDPDTDAEKLARLRAKPLRAPLIIASISVFQYHPKVPELEQDMSAAAATQNMLVAAYAQGIGAMWRTGTLAYDPVVKQGLGLGEHEKIIGFLYLGTISGGTKRLSEPELGKFIQEWQP